MKPRRDEKTMKRQHAKQKMRKQQAGKTMKAAKSRAHPQEVWEHTALDYHKIGPAMRAGAFVAEST